MTGNGIQPSRARLHLQARSRLGLSLLAAFATAALGRSTGSALVRAVLAFDVAACVYLLLAWHMILGATARDTRHRAGLDDPGRRLVFTAVLAAGVMVVVAGLGLIRGGAAHAGAAPESILGMTVTAAVLAWALTHTAFALHYAHLHYDSKHPHEPAFLFPGGEEPDDRDFAYFAFTVGMTFQVSDVQVLASRCRRVVLAHGLLAFGYNTVIVAMVLNLIFTQLQSGRG